MDGKELAGYVIAFLSGGGIGTFLTYVAQTRSYNLDREKWEHERTSHEREERVSLVAEAWAAMESADKALLGKKPKKADQFVERAVQLSRRVRDVLGSTDPSVLALAEVVDEQAEAWRSIDGDEILTFTDAYEDKLQRARDAYLPALRVAREWPSPK